MRSQAINGLGLLANILLPASAHPGSRLGTSLGHRSNDTGLPIYKDASYCVDTRVEDLLSRMTVEEKAGQMFQTQLYQIPLDKSNTRVNATQVMIQEKHMTHFNLMGEADNAGKLAEFINSVQQLALETRLGIPVTLSTDPRHHFTYNVGTGFPSGVFSQWPETLGLAALRDPVLVRRFAEIAREEYVAVGIRSALHPQVDVVTEPRWIRIANTWGESAELTTELMVEYIKGFQGDGWHGQPLGPYSVTTVTKHFPGGGAKEDGEDSHFSYGKNQTYPGHNWDYHLIPFKKAIEVGARQMMPYYSRPIGTKYEPVGFSFNKEIVTDLLRDELGFQGIVVTDWGLITDSVILGQPMPARAWGLEETGPLERVTRILNAGCDQLGGEERPELIVELVNTGVISEARLDISVRRLLKEKFLLGLFDNPFVDPEVAQRVVGNQYFSRLANETQRRAYTLLTNKDNILPLTNLPASTRFYIEGFNATELEARNFTVVDTPEAADYALLRMDAPYRPRPGNFEATYHAGNLEYTEEEKKRQAAIYKLVPTIVDIIMNRPPAIPEVAERAAALMGSYGSSNDAFLDIVFGVAQPEGKLPFDMPGSWEAVLEQMEDVPFDTRNPTFKFGHGLRYASLCPKGADKCSQGLWAELL
ncbi:hypothetical protein ACHAPT_011811 [Fusarium lateritium]